MANRNSRIRRRARRRVISPKAGHANRQRPSSTPSQPAKHSRLQADGRELSVWAAGTVGLFADIAGVFFASHIFQIIIAGAGACAAILLLIARRRRWIRTKTLSLRAQLLAFLAIGGVSLAVAGIGIYGVAIDRRDSDRAAMKETCYAFRDYIVASADASAEMAAAGNAETDAFKRADAHVDYTLNSLTAAANRSGSGEAQRLVDLLHQQIAAATGIEGSDVGAAQRTVYEARKTIVQLDDLCSKSGTPESAGVQLAITPTVRQACAAFNQFVNLNHIVQGKHTQNQLEQAQAALNVLTYHAENSPDHELRVAEESLFASFNNTSAQPSAFEKMTAVCTARGFPPT